MCMRPLLAASLVLFFCTSTLLAQAPPDVQPLWDEMGELWRDGDLVGAEAVTDRLVEALEPVATDFSLGIQMNSALHNRASLRYNNGDFVGAEADLLRSVEQARAIQPPAGLPAASAPHMMAMVDGRVRLSLRGLMNFYLAASDLERATRYFQEAQQIHPLWKKQMENNPSIGYQILAAEVSSMEGTFFRSTGDYVKAMDAYLERLEEIDKAWKMVMQMTGGQENSFSNGLKMNFLRGRSNLLMELAEVAVLLEKFEEGIGFCRQSREAGAEMIPLYQEWARTVRQENPAIAQETVDRTVQAVITNTNYLIYERAALVFRAAGDEKAALELMMEGIQRRGDDYGQQRMLTLEYNVIRPEESLQLVGDLQAILGRFEEAAASYEKALSLIQKQYPAGHPAILEIRESESLLAEAIGDREAAVAKAQEVLAGRMSNLETVLSFADESQRLAYRSSIDPWSLFASLDLPDELYETVLRTKGIVLESILEDRGVAKQASDSELADSLAELQTLRRQLMEALLGGAEAGGRDTAKLRERITELEATLSDGVEKFGVAREALRTTVKDVQDSIPEKATLIEFIRYRDFGAPGRFTHRYGAIVIDRKNGPAFIPLAEAKRVEAGMELYAEAVRSSAPDEDMKKFLEALGELIWAPLVDKLPAPGSSLILSPDGALNFFAFATLLQEDGTFVGEAYPISYVSSGRDLLRKPETRKKEEIAIIANPDFQTPATEEVAGTRRREGSEAVSMRGVLGRIGLSPLPGTKAEEEAVSALIRENWKWEIESHLEREATEEAVNRVSSPGVLHLATHGFYLPRTGRQDTLERSQRYWDRSADAVGQAAAAIDSFSDVVLDNPMHRSGIALAGAEATLKQWGAGTILDTSKDGILTAEEMSQLDLDGTWLVVLSACETGLGEARSGEGVLGMRRGLLQAGAENLLLTLWPVADRETALFMIDLYRNLDAGKRDPAEVVPRIQAAYLKEFRESKGITAAVKLAGPFIVSFQM